MSTYFPKAGEIARRWYVVDASGQALGRVASQVARILMGKENPKYTPFIDTGGRHQRRKGKDHRYQG
jgi:large subunit ribosomal protein L13